MNDLCMRHPDAKPQRSHLGRYCPECLRESFANNADIEAAEAALGEPGRVGLDRPGVRGGS